MAAMNLQEMAQPTYEPGASRERQAESRPARPYLWVVVAVAALGFLLRLLAADAFPPKLASDASAYHGMATHLAAGSGFSLDGETPTRIRPPTYPVFLAAIYLVVGPSLKAALVCQSLLGAVLVVLVYALASRILDARSGLLAALITAFYPAMIYYDTRILREGLTALLVTGCVYYAAGKGGALGERARAVLVGALIGVVSLCRPETLVLCLPIGYMLARPVRCSRELWRSAVLLAIPILLLWAPWTIRNYATFGSISPVTRGLGSVLWFGSRWAETGGDSQTLQARNALKQSTNALAQGATEGEIEGRFMGEALRDIGSRPFWFAEMVARKVVLFWKDANGVRKTLPRIHRALPLLLNTYYYTLLIMAAMAVILGHRRHERVLPLAGVVLTYMMTYALLHVRNRYRVPILPLVFVLSAGGFWMLYDLVRQAVGKRLAGVPSGRPAGETE